MAYPNYSPYYPQYMPNGNNNMPNMNNNIQNMNNAIPGMNTGIIWVQGESGAKAYPVVPGTSIALFDSETERFYIKTIDQSGMPQPLRIFDYSEHSESDTPANLDTSKFVTRDEFETAIAKLKRSNNKGGNNNGKSLIQRTDD